MPYTHVGGIRRSTTHRRAVTAAGSRRGCCVHPRQKAGQAGHRRSQHGGLLAFWIAATAPDAVGPVISVDGIPFYSALHFPEATPDDMRSWADKKRTFLQSASRPRAIIQNRIALASMVTDQQDLQELATMLDRCDTETVGQATYELMTTDVRDELTSIQTPVLLIGATGSSTSPEERQQKEDRYRQQVSSIPQHEVIFHSESRHFIQYDAPEFLWREMERFLKQHASVESP